MSNLNKKENRENFSSKFSTGAIVGIIIGGLLVLFFIFYILSNDNNGGRRIHHNLNYGSRRQNY